MQQRIPDQYDTQPLYNLHLNSNLPRGIRPYLKAIEQFLCYDLAKTKRWNQHNYLYIKLTSGSTATGSQQKWLAKISIPHNLNFPFLIANSYECKYKQLFIFLISLKAMNFILLQNVDLLKHFFSESDLYECLENEIFIDSEVQFSD